MRDYGKIAPAFWIGSTGRSLRGDPAAQLVAAYLLTAPGSNMIGFYYVPIATIANDTGLSVEGASKALQRVSEGGFCSYDPSSEWVWVHEMARFQVDVSLAPTDNRVKGIAKDFNGLPESPMKQGFYARYRGAFHLPEWHPSRSCEASPFEAPLETLRSQEQEQEQEQTYPLSQEGEQTSPVGCWGEAGTGSGRARLAVVGGQPVRAGGRGR